MKDIKQIVEDHRLDLTDEELVKDLEQYIEDNYSRKVNPIRR